MNVLSKSVWVGVDAGGTFTDFVFIDAEGEVLVRKVPSTPSDPSVAILMGLRQEASLKDAVNIAITHGTTVATNALLERKGARTALVTTAGFKDVLEIGRQTRQNLYSLSPSRPLPLIPAEHRFELLERVDWQGNVLVQVDKIEAEKLISSIVDAGFSSLAVCFLFSYLNSENERTVGEIARRHGLEASLSCDISPEPREFERTSTTVANAFVSPIVSRYLSILEVGLQDFKQEIEEKTTDSRPNLRCQLRIMQSNGGSLSSKEASAQAIKTAMSGPAGGIVAGIQLSKQTGCKNLITFDMGGTSTDVAMILEGVCTSTSGGMLNGLPIRTPMLDIHTVGAGGGSIARIDLAGGLRVGPESAGASPGPVGYGVGERVTVTDANLVLKRLPSAALLAGSLPMDYERAKSFASILGERIGRTAEEVALGIVSVAEAEMARAIRHISVEKGQSPSSFDLLSFGGAGGLHACSLAKALGLNRVLIPPYPGAFSALGLALAPIRREVVRSFPAMELPGDYLSFNEKYRDDLSHSEQELTGEIMQAMTREGLEEDEIDIEMSIDLRYRGQSFYLRVPFAADAKHELISCFHRYHKIRYGYANENEPVEAVAMRCAGAGRLTHPVLKIVLPETPGTALSETLIYTDEGWRPARLYSRRSLCAGQIIHGNAIILQSDTTIYVPEYWKATTDVWGNLICERSD